MVKAKFFKKHVQIPILRLLRNTFSKRILWGFIFFLAIMLIMGINFMPQKVEVGQPAPRKFESKRALTFESEVLTEIAREEAAAKVKPVYKVDEYVLQDLLTQIDGYFQTIHRVRNSEFEQELKGKKLEEELGIELNKETLTATFESDIGTINAVQQETKQLVRQFMSQGVHEDEVSMVKKNMLNAVSLLNINSEFKVLVASIIKKLNIKENMVYDAEATEELKAIARENVEPVEVEIKPGQVIVGEGVIITEFQYEQLEKLGLLETEKPYTVIMGLALLIAILFALVILYVYQYKNDIYHNYKLMILLGLLVVSSLLITRAVMAISLGTRAELSMLVGYMAPLAAGPMLIAILLDNKLAVFVTIILAIFVGIMSGTQLQIAIVAVVGGLAGVYSVSHLSQRSDLAKASLYMILANVLTIIALGLIFNHSLTMLTVGVILGIINGILSSVLTIGFLPFWETAFGITTSVKLLELSNPNQPLLRKLLVEAPGTYHHSILVGNLAEAAAEEVGADSLLARVGAYYHDIGKIKRPYFFIENQLTAENPHDKLAPTLSTLIITSHVKDGVEMAKEYKLPQSIIDIIQQHHGNSLLSFFYQKAVENSNGDNSVSKDDFRYENCKPRTKEAAIVMLADGVEAGVRSMQKPTPNRIEAFVKKIIKERLEDNQLEECDLTFKELDVITQAFVRVLNGIFHSRIEYPEKLIKEIERGKGSSGSSNKEPAAQSGNT